MGNAPSKTARKLPRENPSWAGSRVPPAATTDSPARPRPERPLAFKSKHEAIERDVKDPRFMEKLNQLGTVRVDHHMQTVRAASDIQNMFRSRIRSEVEAASQQSTENRLLISSLTQLLEARKFITDNAELETLAKQYHVDAKTLQLLGRVVNTPSIDENTIVRTTDERGEESLAVMAHWVDPVPPRVQYS